MLRRVKPRVSLARERVKLVIPSHTHTHIHTHTHSARARTIRIGHARNQLERDMRDCSTRQTHALARSIIQVAARRDAAPIAFGYGRARTKELPGREGGGSHLYTWQREKRRAVSRKWNQSGTENWRAWLLQPRRRAWFLQSREHDDVIRRCRRKTRNATDCKSCHPRRFIPSVSLPPAIYRRPLRIHSANVVRRSDPMPTIRTCTRVRRYARRCDAN